MTETLISSLSQIPNLNVKARSLVFRYKGKDTNPQIVGRDLDVQAVLNGRVVQRGADLTLYLELVDARSGNLIWGDQYKRNQADLISLQGEIARDVSSKLKMKLTGADEEKMTKNYTSNAEAYRLYLRGRFYANKRTAADAQRAIDAFNQAIAIDPNYALAYAGLGLGYSYLAIYGHTPSKEVFPKALECAKKAIELDNTLGEPYLTIGLLTFLQEHDISAFERGTKRALELNPNSTDAHRLNGLRLMFLGKFDESITSLRRALEIEPLSLPGNLNYAYCLFYSGRIDDGEAHLKKTLELSPEFWLSHYYLSSVYRFKKDFARAAEELAIAKDLRSETEAARLIRDSFKKGGWQEVLRAVTTAGPKAEFYPYDLATFYAELGDKDHAFAKLNQAIEEQDQYIGFMKVDPFMQPLHDDPRYSEMLKKAGFPE
jgi:tetratricopeptide (TPR) repeat protein